MSTRKLSTEQHAYGMFDEIVLQTLTKIEKGGGTLMWENDLDCHVVSFEEVIS